jgi:hypothetical protein
MIEEIYPLPLFATLIVNDVEASSNFYWLIGIGWGRQQVGSRIWQKRESCDARVPTYEAAEPTQSRSRRV